MILRTTALVDDVPRRVVSAALPAFVDEFPLLGGRFRPVYADVDGWAAVAVRGWRACRLDVRLTATPAGTLVTCSATWRAAGGMLAHRSRVLAVLTSLAAGVRARALGLVAAPVVVGTAVVRDGCLLAQQRSYPPEAAGLWELPGGRVEPGESDEDAVARECAEELGVEVAVGAPVGPDVALPNGMLLRIYRAALVDEHARPHPHDHADLRWLTAGQLGSVPWLPADRVLLPALRRLLRGVPGKARPGRRTP
ncbi:hypothetical protein JCM33774_04580 [Actinophytocola sp. KF-1]